MQINIVTNTIKSIGIFDLHIAQPVQLCIFKFLIMEMRSIFVII